MPNGPTLLWISAILGAVAAIQPIFPKTTNRLIQYIDHSILEGETLLTDADFISPIGKRRRRRELPLHIELRSTDSPADDEPIDDSAMYSRDRFEGDIVRPGEAETDEQTNGTFGKGIIMRNAVRQSSLKWANARIPFTISTQYTSFGRQRIASALREYHEKTCVRFVAKQPSDIDYVHIVPQDGCFSMVGKTGGKQPVSIGDGCIQKGIIIHELMHSVGFFHEQSRADRDQYIKVVWNNVEPGLEDQFDKYSLSMIDHLGTKYDYASVMHYGPTAFSKNGQATIQPIETGVRIGQRIGFSPTDLQKINRLYDCPAQNAPSSPPNPTNGAQPVPGAPTLPISVNGLPDGTIQTSLPSAPTPCADIREDCVLLAARGHCSSVFGQLFMSIHCARTCGHCQQPVEAVASLPNGPVECTDERPWCERWASSGMCGTFLLNGYMKAKCTRSCGLCPN